MARTFRVALGVLLLLAGSPFPAIAERLVRVGVFAAPPLVFIEDGKPQGLFIDLIRDFAKKGGWKVSYVEAPWGQQLKALEAGEIDLLPAIGYTQPRQAFYDFSREPVFIDSGVVFSGPRFTVHTLYDLKGKRVAALGTSIFTDAFRTNMAAFGIDCQIVPTTDNEEVMRDIVEGKVDAGVCIYSLGSFLARSYPVTMTPITFSPIALEFATPKGKGSDLLAVIDRELGAMRTDPTSVYSQSYKKWTGPPESWTVPAWVWWILGILVFVGTLLAAMALWLNRLVKARTRSLMEEKERLAVTLDSIADGVITSDNEGRVQLMNPVADSLCGWDLGEALGRPVAEVFVLEHLGEKQEGLGAPADRILVSRQGTRRRIVESQVPILSDTGEVLGSVRSFRDMSERDKLIESLLRTEKLEALGVLAGGIAHDFNNLLAGIFGFIELARQSDVGPRGVKYLDKAVGVFSRAKGLSHQLLTFSKGGSPAKKPTDLTPLIRASASFAGAGSNVRLELSLAPDLWNCDVDENQICQVFDNLIINARQAMPNGGRLLVEAWNLVGPEPPKGILLEGPLVAIALSDEGVGISPENQPKVFAPFFTTKATGHGLGLATCRSIVTKHGGFLDFQSVPGQGTTFRIFLPAVGALAEEASTRVPPEHRGTGVILIMDDEAFVVEILSTQLQGLGYKVLAASDGEQLIEDILPRARATGDLRAVFLDMTIPGGLGGRETLGPLRRCLPETPIFASSGFSDDPVMAEPVRYGFTASIRKPYLTEDLVRLLNRYVPGQG